MVLAIFELKLWKSENPYKGSPYKSAQEPEKARFDYVTLKLISAENFEKIMTYAPYSTSNKPFDMTQAQLAKKNRLTGFLGIFKIFGPIFIVILLHK